MQKSEESYGVSLQGFIPVRKEAHERSEMVTQVLFGEYFSILDDEGIWTYIRTLNDNYEGWIDSKCIVPDSPPIRSSSLLAVRNTVIQNLSHKHKVMIPAAATIPASDGEFFSLAGQDFQIVNKDDIHETGSLALTALVEDMLSVPYIWGGRCGFGTDCSGLTQYLCRAMGKASPRDASEQSAVGETLSFLNEAKPGDLAFFDDKEGMIHHVGMIIEEDKIIHSSGRVRIDKLDQQGIFNAELGRYTHKLRVLKRV